MAIVANIATFPGRIDQCAIAIKSMAHQVDIINVVLNEYVFVPGHLKGIERTNFIFPPQDLKDVGKFYPNFDDEDDIFLCDDDIVYPSNYVAVMMEHRAKLNDLNPILGLHGGIYSDYYDGKHRSGRLVDVFTNALDRSRVVNQLGTGTVYCKGWQMPTFEFMMGSERFVDVRFAIHAYEKNYPSICISREKGWLQQLEINNSIYESFTASSPINVIHEIQRIAGFSKLDGIIVRKVEELNE